MQIFNMDYTYIASLTLSVNYEAIRRTVAEHLENISKKLKLNKCHLEEQLKKIGQNATDTVSVIPLLITFLINNNLLGQPMTFFVDGARNRQKHNGMSWSKDGSVALSTVKRLHLNNVHKNWYSDGVIDYKLVV